MRLWSQGVAPGPAAGAIMPPLTVTPKATTHRQVHIWGQPGTLGVAVPKPNGLVPVSQTRDTQGSYRAPDVIFPQLYVAGVENMHPPVSLFRDNQMPVPARGNFGAVGQLAPQSFKRRGTGGQAAIDWPAVVQRFPNRVTRRFNNGG